VLGALIGLAAAQTTCSDLEPDRFRSLIIDSQSALDRGDLDLLKTVLAEVEKDLPCLRFAPPPRLWADLMAVQAVANFADGADWKSPLAAALRIRPGIDRGVGRSHPIYTWTPEETPPNRPFSGPSELYVDGRESDLLPPVDGWYLIQKTDGEYWESYWQRDVPVSTTWVNAAVDRPAEVFWQLGGGLQAGFAHITQVASQLEDTEWIPRNSRFYSFGNPMQSKLGGAAVWGVVFKGKVSYRNLGISMGGSALWGLSPALRDGRISAVYDTAHFTAGVGASINDVFLLTRSSENSDVIEDKSVSFDRFYHGVVGARAGHRLVGEATALAGFQDKATFNGLLDLTLTFEELEFLGARPQIGGQVGFAMGRFIREDVANIRVVSISTRISTHITLLLGSPAR